MAQYGQVISKHRKLNNLTQSQLAEQLFVSPQAVSKWEKNQSEPDLSTIKNIAAIFNLTLDQFFEEEKEITIIETDEVSMENCIVCQTPYAQIDLSSTDDGKVCHTCKKELEKEKQFFLDFEQTRPSKVTVTSLKGKLPFYIGWGAGLVFLIFGIIAFFLSSEPTDIFEYFYGVIFTSFILVSFLTLMLYDSWLRNFFLGFAGATINMPGIIFELSIDGLIGLIITKIFFGLIALSFTLIVFLLGFMLALIISPIAYIVELSIKLTKGFDYNAN